MKESKTHMIEYGRMKFTIKNEPPSCVTNETKREIENTLFNVFEKYENINMRKDE